MKKLLLVVLSIILIFTFTACNKQAAVQPTEQKVAETTKIELTDLKGRTVTFDKIPSRIVSLSPSITEILFAVGAQDKVVGVTSYCDYPEQVKNIEKIGTFDGPNIELIKKAQPDVVLAGGYIQEDIIKALEALNIPVLSTEATDFNSIFDSITLIGKLTGNDGNAQKIVDDMKAEINTIAEKTKGVTPKKVFYVVWTDPLTTAGAGTFINDVIKTAGGVNTAEKVQYWAKYSTEELMKDNPDMLIAALHSTNEGMTKEDFVKNPIFSNLECVKNGNIYIMSDDNIISRPGPRIVEAIKEMVKAMYGENL